MELCCEESAIHIWMAKLDICHLSIRRSDYENVQTSKQSWQKSETMSEHDVRKEEWKQQDVENDSNGTDDKPTLTTVYTKNAYQQRKRDTARLEKLLQSWDMMRDERGRAHISSGRRKPKNNKFPGA